MPGIAGFITPFGIEASRSCLDQMLGAMVREPFHNSGTLFQDEFGLSVGWVCQKGSYSDCLPIWNEQRNICLIFLGEHYADKADAEKFRKSGRDFSPDDAQWLVHLYEEHGPKFFEKLNGVFSGVLVDCKARQVVLFNDRFGLSRIYCHERPDGFYFASEAKSLLRVLPSLRQLDLQSFGEFLTCGCVLQGRSIFSGVTQLAGASAWVFASGQTVRKETYFQKSSWEDQAALRVPEYYEKMSGTFTRILPRYFQGQQRVGLSLTGGLDSRMIIAAAPSAPHTLPCYTFGGMYRECADVKLARRIATICEQDHQVITVSANFFSEFPNLAEKTIRDSDGAMDVMGSVELFANRFAREIAPVRLTGNYGSEVLRGNVAFKPMRLNESIFDTAFVPFLNQAKTTYEAEREGSRTSFITFKQVPWHHYARWGLEQSQISVRSPFLDNDLVAVAFQAPAEISVNRQLAHRFIEESNPKLKGVPTDRGVFGQRGVLAGKFGDFCREFMPRAEYVYDYGMPQWLAKADRWMRPLHVERLFLGRQKFYHFRVWYRDALSSYIKELLLDSRTLRRPYLIGRYVEKIVSDHVKGRGNYTLEIHKLLTSELIQRQLIEQN